MKVKQLELIFQDDESVVIDGKFIKLFHIEDINKSITKYSYNDDIHMKKKCNYLELVIDSKADYDFDKQNSAFNRIYERNDIRIVSFLYDNKEEYDIYHVLYPELEVNINKAMKSYIDSNGNLYIIIDNSDTVDFEDKFFFFME